MPDGYPRLATFMEGNDSFMIFRRFGYLQTRLLLEKEARLAQLERNLDEMDWEYHDNDPNQLRRADPLSDAWEIRREFLEAAETQFRQYADLMTTVQQLRCFESPTERDYKALRRFHYTAKPLLDSETDAIRNREDLVALRLAKEPDWLEGWIERSQRDVAWTSFVGQEVHQCDEVPKLEPNAPATDISGSRITNLATAIVAFLSAILLVLPVLICYILVSNVGGSKGYFGCIGILFLFTMIFACSMSFYSKAKRHEVLAATAAYCAVIVVFLGNATPN
ncbi:hypothetical protein BU23DRAFT_654222 [Bimuria novae-zelandiae CBS 107.79]|uniref:DUF6594 domain-containing protein n=1 Tax=Bimuria novae-zelandiae CBS 107.79 TaxID=1447943 RepID=A0A6A5VT00_9PLEO|nr:hypothetical protein BU23DRAFT_654222 [Bimuria novae-zelandiae CBS 107.79]